VPFHLLGRDNDVGKDKDEKRFNKQFNPFKKIRHLAPNCDY